MHFTITMINSPFVVGSFIYFVLFFVHSFTLLLPFNSANMLLVSLFRLSHCPLCWRLAQLSVEFHFPLSFSRSLSLSPPLNTWQFRAKWNVSMSWFMYFTMRSSAAPPLLVPSASHPMQSPSAAASSSCLFSDGTFHCCYLCCCSCCLSHFVWTDLNVS